MKGVYESRKRDSLGWLPLWRPSGVSRGSTAASSFELSKVQAGRDPDNWKPLFLELGFSAAEAKRLHAASQKQINDTRVLKEQLMTVLSSWIEQHHLKQSEAAEILMVSRPRVSDVVNKKTAKFTIDTLVEMLSHIGKPVTLAVG
jgi:predicted XRE-type DNA-binding protein